MPARDSGLRNMPSFKIFTLGCKVNFYESEALKERLINLGFEEKDDADYYFVNTCAVTNEAEKKDRKKVRELARNHPDSKIIVMGCSSQIHPDSYKALPNVISVIGNQGKDRVEECILSASNGGVNDDFRHFLYEDTPIDEGEYDYRAFVKIQDGCDNFCSYCLVPFARGNSRCRNKDSILKEIDTLVSKGTREIVVSGIDTGCYKDPFDPSCNLTSLLKEIITTVQGDYRIRVSSIEASQIDDAYIQLFRDNQERLCPHFHIPLQSGSQRVLTKMNRKYDLNAYLDKLEKIREAIDRPAISTDVILGFPSEDEEAFSETLAFIEKADFMRIHAFPYSEREKTAAYQMKDKVDYKVRLKRTGQVIQLGKRLASQYSKSLEGLEGKLLVAQKTKDGRYKGYTERYVEECVSGDDELLGKFILKVYD